MSASPLLVVPARGLDVARAALLRRIGRSIAPLLRDRARRVGVLASASILVALVLALVAPIALLAVGPIVLGIPHLAADLRYLVIRRGLHRRPAVWGAVFVPSALAWFFAGPAPFLAIVGAGLVARGRAATRLAIVALGLVAVALVARFGRTADVVLAHAHNVVAIGIAIAWSRTTRRTLVACSGLFTVVSVLLLAGAFDRVWWHALLHGAPRSASPLSLDALVATFSPLADPIVGLRMVVFFAFAQSVHYAVWLRVVPEIDRPKPAPRPFVASLDALANDLGGAVLLLVAIASLAIGSVAFVDLDIARDGYLRLARFHGPLELALVGLLLAERRLPIVGAR
jgi:hypothetical protein